MDAASPAAASHPSTEDLALRPFHWLVRLVAAHAAVCAALLAARLVTGWHAQRQLDAELARIAAAGELILPADFQPRLGLPRAGNAAWVLDDAALAVADPNGPRNSNYDFDQMPTGGPLWTSLAGRSESYNAAALHLARQARLIPQTDSEVNVTSPMPLIILPTLNRSRELANVVADSAEYHSRVLRDHAGAAERVLDLLGTTRAVEPMPFVVSQLVGIGITDMAGGVVQVTAPAVDFGDPAARAAWMRVRDALLNGPPGDVLLRAWDSDRASIYDTQRCAADATWLTRPVHQREMLRQLREAAPYRAAFAVDSMPAHRAILASLPAPAAPKGGTFLGAIASPVGTRAPVPPPRPSRVVEMQRQPGGRWFETHCCGLADRRMAAAQIALLAFRHDTGRWPATLDELVPTHLPAVPTDPYTGGPIQFAVLPAALPDGNDRVLVFCNTSLNMAPGLPAGPGLTVNGWSSFYDVIPWRPPPTTGPASGP